MRYTKAERKRHVMQQTVSGITITSYCEEHSINYHTFQNWRRKYKDAEFVNSETSYSGSFLEIMVPKPALGLGGITIFLPNGVRLQLDREVDGELLKLLSHV